MLLKRWPCDTGDTDFELLGKAVKNVWRTSFHTLVQSHSSNAVSKQEEHNTTIANACLRPDKMVTQYLVMLVSSASMVPNVSLWDPVTDI